MDIIWFIHIKEYYSAMRRNEVLTHTGTRMDTEDTMLSDILNQIRSDQSLSHVRLNSEVKVAQLCLTPCDPMDCSPPGSSVHGNSPGKNTGVGSHSLLQGIFQNRDRTQVSYIAGSLYHLSHQGKAQVLYDFIYMKHLTLANSERQTVD